MKNEFVPYEEALALKELGVDKKCFGFYSPIHDLMICNTSGINEEVGECLAPLFQQTFRWFREKYHIKHRISSYAFGYKAHLNNTTDKEGWDKDRRWACDKDYESYEEAELACLKKLIEIVKENFD